MSGDPGQSPPGGSTLPRPPWLIYGLFALFAAVHALRLPLFEGPDEPGNLLYLQFVASEGRLAAPSLEPTAELEVLDRGIVPPLWFVALAPLVQWLGADQWRFTAAQNPHFLRRASAPPEQALSEPTNRLHYIHGADEREPLDNPAWRALVLLRLLSVPFALLALHAVWRTAHLVAALVGPVGPSAARFAVLAAGLGALTPQLQHLSGTLTMDLALAAMGSWSLYFGAKWAAAGTRAEALRAARWAGFFAALAGLIKLNGLVLFPALALCAWVSHRRARTGVAPLLQAAGVVLLFAGPWYAMGFAETGHPLWPFAYQAASPYHNPPGMEPPPHSFDRWSAFVLLLVLTWVGNFAWTAVWFPLPVTAAVFVLVSSGAAAAVCALGTRGRGTAAVAGTALLGGVLACTWVGPWGERFFSGPLERYGAYGTAILLPLALLVGLLWKQRRRGPVGAGPGGSGAGPAERDSARAALLALGLCGALILVAEVGFNLRFSQPQARHLYPFLPALLVPVALGLSRLGWLPFAVLLHGGLSVLGVVWVERYLRPPGWNGAGVFHATDVLRREPPPTGPVPERAPQWVAPAAGAVLGPDAPPVFAFTGASGGPHELLFAVDNPEFADAPWRPGGPPRSTLVDLGLELRGGPIAVPVPGDLWRSLPEGARVDARVRALDEAGRHLATGATLTLRRGP